VIEDVCSAPQAETLTT